MRVTLPGRYLYTAPGADPVIVVVMEDDGQLVACFPEAGDEDCEGPVVAVSELAGDFTPLRA